MPTSSPLISNRMAPDRTGASAVGGAWLMAWPGYSMNCLVCCYRNIKTADTITSRDRPGLLIIFFKQYPRLYLQAPSKTIENQSGTPERNSNQTLLEHEVKEQPLHRDIHYKSGDTLICSYSRCRAAFHPDDFLLQAGSLPLAN